MTDREHRDVAAGGFVLGVVVCLPLLVMSCVRLSEAQQAQIARDQVGLSVCASIAHDAKEDDAGAARAWAVFDDCMIRKGFYDGGGDAR